MSTDVSALFGAAATIVSSVGAGITLGRSNSINDAVKTCAEFTAEKASQSTPFILGEAIVCSAAVAGTTVKARFALNQDRKCNKGLEKSRKKFESSIERVGKLLGNLADAVPIVGHVKGTVHYALGQHDSGAKSMKNSSRTCGVLLGATLGLVSAGPGAAVAGAVAGGAAMDGITTGVESAIIGKFSPNGQILAWSRAFNAESEKEILDGVVGILCTPLTDSLVGYVTATQIVHIGGNGVVPLTLIVERTAVTGLTVSITYDLHRMLQEEHLLHLALEKNINFGDYWDGGNSYITFGDEIKYSLEDGREIDKTENR